MSTVALDIVCSCRVSSICVISPLTVLKRFCTKWDGVEGCSVKCGGRFTMRWGMILKGVVWCGMVLKGVVWDGLKGCGVG